MFFDAEFFLYDPNFCVVFFELFGESDLEIPENLFDPGIPVIDVNQSFAEPEYFDLNFYFFDDFFSKNSINLFGSTFFNSEEFINNLFYSRNSSRSYNDFFELQNFISDINSEILDLRSVCSSDFTELINIISGRNPNEIQRLDQLFSLYGFFSESFNFYRHYPENYKKFLDFSESISRKTEKIFEFSDTYSEKLYEIFDVLPGGSFEINRNFGQINYSLKNEEIIAENYKLITPKNIFSAASENNFIEFLSRSNTEKSIFETERTGLNRRVDQIEEIIRNSKKTVEIDYDSVVRRLDLELRSALNSCSEGVHF